MPVQPVAMVVLACRVLAIAVALSCLVRAEAYLSTESGKTYECDITKVDAFTASENQKRCKEFCTRFVSVPGADCRSAHVKCACTCDPRVCFPVMWQGEEDSG